MPSMPLQSVYELNFVENAKGVRRIVGDSQEVIGDYDLCLITSPDLEHVWEQNECHSDDIREITIQFDFSMGDETLFGRNPYASITRMMQEAKKGLSFPMQAIMNLTGWLIFATELETDHTAESLRQGIADNRDNAGSATGNH
jgi:hypothetical protein